MKSILYSAVKPVIDYNLLIRSQILEICKPLFDNFGITYFEYDQIREDGKVFYICTNSDWLEFSLENKMFDDEEHVLLCSLAKTHNHRYALWNTLKLESTRLLSNYSHCNVWNGFTINETEETNFNVYSFATTKDNTGLNEFFINNLSLFEHFIIYFKQKLRLILDKEPKNLIFEATPLKDMSSFTDYTPYNNKINLFLEQTTLQKFEINVNSKTTYLTKRQLQCLRMLAAGKTSKEIGNQLEISQRTVESYINAIKNKTGVIFKSDLISIFEKNFLNLYKFL